MVAAETARKQARSLDFYAAIEAADACDSGGFPSIQADFHPSRRFVLLA
jgi:hypothetical protein